MSNTWPVVSGYAAEKLPINVPTFFPRLPRFRIVGQRVLLMWDNMPPYPKSSVQILNKQASVIEQTGFGCQQDNVRGPILSRRTRPITGSLSLSQ